MSDKKGSIPLGKTVAVGLIAAIAYFATTTPDLLDGLSNNVMLKPFQLQMAVTGFCLSGTADKLAKNNEVRETFTGGDGADNFVQDGHGLNDAASTNIDGDIENDEYTKQSIYALLYSLYAAAGTVKSDKGIDYQFTFNTWGIAPGYEQFENDPQSHGKAAYRGLVNFDHVHDYMKTIPNPTILEIGCGTGAGANLITDLLPTATYYALDMQKAAYETCKSLHAVGKEDRLKCIHGNGKSLLVDDSSIDFVVISETHIADIEIGPEEKAIFAEIKRVLKPQGLFVWGNALPTRVWFEALDFLPTIGMNLCPGNSALNHTKGAVIARQEDEARVNVYCEQLYDIFPIYKVAQQCRHVSDRLIKNFYRHPGTALYDRMVTGYDSYMHYCFQSDGEEL